MSRRVIFGVFVLLGCARQEQETIRRTEQAAFKDSAYLATPRTTASLITLASGDVLLTGGYDGTSYVNTLQTWTKATGLWSTPETAPFEFALPASVELPDKRVFVIGSGGAILYDPSLKLVTYQTASNTRRDASVMVLPSGKVLVAAGRDEAMAHVPAQLFDPATKTFAAAGTMKDLRIDHGFVRLADGAFVIGGANYASGTTYLSSVERYSAATNSWSEKASMKNPRSSAVVVGLASGKVLAAGGYDGSFLSSAEIYDPASDAWTPVVSLPSPRVNAGAVLLKSGRVLVVGGNDGKDALSSTLLFDPTAGTWTKGPSTKVAHETPMVTALGDGRVMVLGGISGYADGGDEIRTNAVEIFGGLAAGAPCTVGEECSGGTCTSGTCGGSTDAGADTSSPSDTGASPMDSGASIDATPPDHGKPVVSGDVQRCQSDTQCASGFCVDGVCCDTRCAEPCHSCVLPSAPGHCSLEPFGVDHANACGKAGTCVGTCDGKGGCTSATGGAQCRPSHCTSTGAGASAAFCSATGSSCDESALVAFECAPYACDEAFGACLSVCKTSRDCADGFVCDTASRSCVGGPSEDSGGCVLGAPSAGDAGVPALMLALAAVVRWRRSRACSRACRSCPVCVEGARGVERRRSRPADG